LLPGGVGEHLAGNLEVGLNRLQGAPGIDHFLQLTVALGDLSEPTRIRREVRVVELCVDRVELPLELGQALLEPLDFSFTASGREATPSELVSDQDAGGAGRFLRDPVFA
jgi:hypothetical protein